MRPGPRGDIATHAGANRAAERASRTPASARPITSSMRSFVVVDDVGGKIVEVERRAHPPRGELSSASGHSSLSRREAAQRPRQQPQPRPGIRSSPAAPRRTIRSGRCSHPMIVGPTNPPVVPIELMNARPPAAAMPVRNRGGIVQKMRARAVDAGHRDRHPRRPTSRSCPANRIAPRNPHADSAQASARLHHLAAAAIDVAAPTGSSPIAGHDVAAAA